MLKKIGIAIIVIIIISGIIATTTIFNTHNEETELKTVQSEAELMKIYTGDEEIYDNIFFKILTMPFSILYEDTVGDVVNGGILNETNSFKGSTTNSSAIDPAGIAGSTAESSSSADSVSQSSKDYSKTNIQVENVDEADITKTDGDYIYSISNNNVIITNVKDPNKIEIAAKIVITDGSIPEDLILYKDKLVVIATINGKSSSYYSYSSYNSNTAVKIYDIADKTKPTIVKEYELYEPYYTSRCINNELYVISSGNLRKEDDKDKIITTYEEDKKTQEIPLDNIKYLNDVKTKKQTLISAVNLDDVKKDIKVNSYLIDIANAYVSEKAIYLLDENYEYNDIDETPPISTLFGLKGALGPFAYYEEQDDKYSSSGYYTEVYKFEISKDGNINYSAKTKIKGKTINQYSLDEYNGHLRVALYDNDGSRVAIFDEKLKQIGISANVAKYETMYASRFIGDKVYLVTYLNTDPLFVIDLSNEEKPKVLGELKIPGYSTYLHPYDENHLIGIGMESEEVVKRDSNGRVISNTSNIIGMKMALFDVSDVNNPIQISNTVIGDRRTTSAILTNPKALLFSKEKSLIAIPVNNYSEDFSINGSKDNYSAMKSYMNYNKPYISEGYFVYNIDLTNGFNLKGIITHESDTNKNLSYSYYGNSKLLRGLYIDKNLYTVSETAVKVHDLETLKQISELKLK